ncbi:MOSC domain-containing protein YiiM [Deinobacterium chartae]|uniref:MOSC domain-containing protein YiiM n=1 Tax=Deinobacterium chartae TaxID=521158 RepID=A0A841HX87_9DEIO|nr:MOSC domain-containing protein [Deinobacterium chartae]MBB6097463.1 MOSC domain-containing protein YiiM [Deinobacterium chartae]
MQLVAVNLGLPRSLEVGQRSTTTGIFKQPVPGPVRVTALGLEGDAVMDAEHHGGPDQAVYVYSREDYDRWAEQLGEALEPGTFGENLTVSSFGPGPVRLGDRYRIGTALLEVTAPRIPCATLAARMNDLAFVKRFRQMRRPGFYARVLEEGTVTAGDAARRIPAAHDFVTLDEVFELFYDARPPEAALRRILEAPAALRLRRHTEAALAQR